VGDWAENAPDEGREPRFFNRERGSGFRLGDWVETEPAQVKEAHFENQVHAGDAGEEEGEDPAVHDLQKWVVPQMPAGAYAQQ